MTFDTDGLFKVLLERSSVCDYYWQTGGGSTLIAIVEAAAADWFETENGTPGST